MKWKHIWVFIWHFKQFFAWTIRKCKIIKKTNVSLMDKITKTSHFTLMAFQWRHIKVCPFPFPIGIGADDMFYLMTEWRLTSIRDSIETRLTVTMRNAAVSITITSLADIFAFCIGATSPFSSVKYFCALSGLYRLLFIVFTENEGNNLHFTIN